MKNITIELSKDNNVNFLWSELIENFGFEKANKILSQAIDLQKMNGKKDITMPIVFTGTGGLALISADLIKGNNQIEDQKGCQILIFNPKKKLFQILYETK